MCHQFDQVVLPELMSKLERCNEKHWKHLEVDIKLKIDKCKAARNKEKKASNIGGNIGLDHLFVAAIFIRGTKYGCNDSYYGDYISLQS